MCQSWHRAQKYSGISFLEELCDVSGHLNKSVGQQPVHSTYIEPVANQYARVSGSMQSMHTSRSQAKQFRRSSRGAVQLQQNDSLECGTQSRQSSSLEGFFFRHLRQILPPGLSLRVQHSNFLFRVELPQLTQRTQSSTCGPWRLLPIACTCVDTKYKIDLRE